MKIIDLFEYGKNDISFYLAIEEYFLNSYFDCYKEDIFFLWDINKAIISGRNQLIESEIDFNLANKINAKVFRRPSGGGTVFADDGCFMFSFITRFKNKDFVFGNYLTLIVNALKHLGLYVYFSGRNDLMYEGKKFSGNAFYTNKNGSVLHGTFLYNVDLEELVRVLTPSNMKLISKGIKSVKERVINLKDYISLSKDELMNYLCNYINDEDDYIKLSEEEIIKIRMIEKKFLSNDWIYNQKPIYTFNNSKRYFFGLIDIYIDIKNEKIINMRLLGDFFQIKDIEEFCGFFKTKFFNRKEFENILLNININEYILDYSNEEFINLLFEEEV